MTADMIVDGVRIGDVVIHERSRKDLDLPLSVAMVVVGMLDSLLGLA
jgi:hypothetical protein